MNQWSDRRGLELLGIEHPILQAPMAGVQDADLAIAVAKAGGLGALPCALLTPDRIRAETLRFRAEVTAPLNLNFFCHHQLPQDPKQESVWKACLQRYYEEFHLDPAATVPSPTRSPFDENSCRLVEELRPEVVSFHFGLPEKPWMDRVKATGAKVLSSATTVEEARWLEDQGCDAVIAQGWEAGGHRAMFLHQDVHTQVGTMALLPQIVDALEIPVIASGGIADARGIVAAFFLGASAVQLGTAFLLAEESRISKVHREALRAARENETVLTNLFTGRPARGMINRLILEQEPFSNKVPGFPYASAALAPLRAAAEAEGRGDFSPLWAGQAVHLAQEKPAGAIMEAMVAGVRALNAR